MSYKNRKKKTDFQDVEIAVLDINGNETGRTIVLPGEVFDAELNVPLIHQVVQAQLAAARQGTHATKTRGMVSGGGKKPWRQKGTGRARHGSTRAPQWRGGGVVHGPQPRDYSQRTPKKMKAGALRSALSDRARNDAIFVLEDLVLEDTPSTKDALETLATVTKGGNVLIVVNRDEDGAQSVVKSYANAPKTHTLWQDQLNTYDVMNAEEVIFSEDAIASFIERATKPARNRKLPVPAVAKEAADAKVKAVEEQEADKTTQSKAADKAADQAHKAEKAEEEAAAKKEDSK